MQSPQRISKVFVDRLNVAANVTDDWEAFISKQKKQELENIALEEKLNLDLTFSYTAEALQDATLQTAGSRFREILPPISRFDPDASRAETRERVIGKLTAFFNMFLDV